MTAWLITASGAVAGDEIQVAIEVPHGPVVEMLMERGFKVHSINPKQMDRFRDRFTLAGPKDDSRDAEVMASALRTDPRCFRLLAVADPSSSNCASGRASSLRATTIFADPCTGARKGHSSGADSPRGIDHGQFDGARAPPDARSTGGDGLLPTNRLGSGRLRQFGPSPMVQAKFR